MPTVAVPDPDTVRRVLIIKPGSLGDVAKSIPTVRAVRRALPGAEIAWVVKSIWADLLIGNPDIDRLIIVSAGLRGFTRAVGAVRAYRPDVVLDMQGLFASGILSVASRAPSRFTWESGRELSGILTGNPVVPGPRSMNTVECLFGFARLVGAEALDLTPPSYLTGDTAASAGLVSILQDVPKPWVGLHVGASEANKQWPASHWAALVAGLHALGVSPVLMGSRSDAAAAKIISAQSRCEPASLVGRITLRELAAGIAMCDVFVGGDSGATHIAALVGTPVVCLMGATDPQHTGPYGRIHTVISLGLPCSPCFRRPTCDGRYECMTNITPQVVLEACRAKLDAATACARTLEERRK